MRGVLYLALQHIRFYRWRSLTFVLVMATLITIPLLGRYLTEAAETRMMVRAEATPMVYGAAGSALDLVLAGAYFRGDIQTPATMADYNWLMAMRKARLAPIFRAGTSARFPIIGTDIEYLELRGARVVRGRKPVRIGEAALGAEVASTLGLGVGDEILSDAVQAFDLAGAYPVAMTVSGILAHSNTPDDAAILTDLNTGWVVAGFGHGHDELAEASNSAILKQADGVVTANASLPTYIRISEGNLDSFHMHGNQEAQKLTAVLVFPDDDKAAALIRGRVADRQDNRQMVRSSIPIRGLLDDVFAVKKVLDRVTLVLSIAALFALGLVLTLSVQMRRREFEIGVRLGARSGLPALLVLAELLLLALAALTISVILLGLVQGSGSHAIDLWMPGGVL